MKPNPFDIEAERVFLCAMMIRAEIIPQVQNVLQPEDFYREAHQRIAAALFECRSGDLVIVCDCLAKRGDLEKVGGREYMGSLVDAVSTSAGWRYYAQIIKDLSTRRRIIHQCQVTLDACYDRTTENAQILSDIKGRLRAIESSQVKDFEESAALIGKVFDDIEARTEQGSGLVGLSTGFKNLDKPTSGLEPKTTTYLIARPSIGKTSLALNISENVAEFHPGEKTLYFSLESSALALTRRRLSAKSDVYLSRIRNGDVEDSQWPYLVKAADTLSQGLIILDSPKYKYVEALTAFCESMALEHRLSMVVIDHIQLMKTRARTSSRHEVLSAVSERLQDLGKDLDIPVLILCQLNRQIESRPAHKQAPQLSDMKESGDLEQNGDNVIGLWRESKEAEYLQIEGLKARDTNIFRTWLRFDRYTQKFFDCEERYQAPVEGAANTRGYNG